MSAKVVGLLLLLAAVTVESVAQMALKVGSAGGPGILALPFRHYANRFRLTASGVAWTALGVALYAVEILLYTLALHHLDVSVAFPVGSLCFVGVALLSRVFLGERLGRARWIGVLFILAGTIVITL